MNHRPIKPEDFDQWKPLFEGYCAFYERVIDEAHIETVWLWLTDPSHIMEGFVAERDDRTLIGLAHFHPRPNNLAACDTCYLSDLFVAPHVRERGVGDGLYKAVMEECRKRGWPVLNLLTQHSNETAQKLYDRYGAKTDFYWYATAIN